MSKISRYGRDKKPLWLHSAELTYELLKKRSSVEGLSLVPKKEKFATIDEKMADIKSRIGFDISKVSGDVSGEIKTASDDDCGCNSNTNACACPVEDKFAGDNVKKMENILQYIKDMIKHEPHTDILSVINRCSNEEGLGFKDLRINMSKLKDFIKNEISSNKDNVNESVRYEPTPQVSRYDFDDDKAEYYRSVDRG